MTMTVGSLYEKLRALMKSGVDEDTEIRLMTQESWPFENELKGACLQSEMLDDDDEMKSAQEVLDEPESDEEDREKARDEIDRIKAKPEVVFLVEGRQLCYGSKKAWELVDA